MALVRFLRHVTPFNTGEIAGFDDEKALRFVQNGWAELVSDAPVSAGAPTHVSILPAFNAAIEETPVNRMVETGPGRRGRRPQ